MTDMDDILDRLAAYAPTTDSLVDDWGPREREQRLGAILDGSGTGSAARLRFVPRLVALRSRAIAPIAASVTVLALAGAVALVADRGSDRGARPGASDPAGHGAVSTAAGTAGVPPLRATVDTPRLGAHQWAYRSVTFYDQNTSAGPTVSSEWVARDGSGQRFNDDQQGTTCSRQKPADPLTSFTSQTQASFDALPTTVGALQNYLTTHVEGSTSREEAVFTAAGDLLRESDLLASSALRAAFVGVLARLHRTSVHTDTDARGRPAVRVDFVDANQRNGEIQSLYFDPHTFELLEERESTEPATPDPGPSAPYTSTPSGHASTAAQLPTAGSFSVMTVDRVVNVLPPNCGLK